MKWIISYFAKWMAPISPIEHSQAINNNIKKGHMREKKIGKKIPRANYHKRTNSKYEKRLRLSGKALN